MKNYLFFAAAAIALASCSSDDNFATPEVAQNQGNEIGFSAYTSTALQTRGTIQEESELQSIGVFAFYQANNNGSTVDFNTHKFSTPDFMYNQKVTSDATAWTYSPVKFWPNNAGDQLSFFAYAPYDDDTQWSDLGVATDQNNTKMTVNFPIYDEVTAQKDYLWAHPQLNLSNKAQGGDYGIGNKVNFDFKHITSRFELFVGVQQNAVSTPLEADGSNVSTKDAEKWDDPNTTITINSIEFKDIADNVTYKYDLTKDINETAPVAPATTPALNPEIITSGSQDLLLTTDDFQNNIISSTTYTSSGFKRILKQETDPTSSATENGFLFLAPQKNIGDNKVIITYTVKTTAYKEGSTTEIDEANCSEITNTIEKTWSDFASSITDFEAGHAYSLFFLIGMNQVNITASETPWATATDHQVDVPANK